jgi:hypothetical protein
MLPHDRPNTQQFCHFETFINVVCQLLLPHLINRAPITSSNSSDSTSSISRIITEQQTGKAVEGSGCGTISGTMPEFT